jgi:hypothetical protein
MDRAQGFLGAAFSYFSEYWGRDETDDLVCEPFPPCMTPHPSASFCLCDAPLLSIQVPEIWQDWSGV